jgi:hypothetical protein
LVEYEFEMLRRKFWGFILVLMLTLVACAPATDVTTVTPTVRLVNREEFQRESTAIAQAMVVQATEVAGTAVAAQAYVAQQESINIQLAATLRVVVPATQQVVDMSGPVTPGMVATLSPLTTPGAISATQSAGSVILPAASPSPGADTGTGTQFTEIAVSLNVREDDGCVDGPTTSIPAGSTRIYATARAFNIRAGTLMGADWLREGQVVYQSSTWTVESDDDDFCLWFYIEPADVEFTPGAWAVRLYADGQALEPLASFTIG